MIQHTTMKNKFHKRLIMGGLYTGAASIIILGSFFATFSIIKNISIPVLNTSVHGVIFGVLVMYLGIKYFFMVNHFEPVFYQSIEPFSWRNFRRTTKKVNKKRKRGVVV